MLRSQGSELGCFPFCRQSCWMLRVLPTAKTGFEMPSCNFSSLFTSLLIITDIGLEKETLLYNHATTTVCKPFFLPCSAHFCSDCSCSTGEFQGLRGWCPQTRTLGRNSEVNYFLLRWCPGSQRLFLVTSAQLGFHPSNTSDCATKECVLPICEPLISVAAALLSALCWLSSVWQPCADPPHLLGLASPSLWLISDVLFYLLTSLISNYTGPCYRTLLSGVGTLDFILETWLVAI